MTMPHLMNCGHRADGWCLGCVKEMGEREMDAADRITHPEAVVAAWRDLHVPCGPGLSVPNRLPALARLVALDQIEPPQEGCYLKLKEPVT